MNYEQSWAAMTPIQSAGGRPFFNVVDKDYRSGESLADFFERYRKELIDNARSGSYSVFEPGRTEGRGNFIYFQYLMRPGPNDCLYHVVEHIFRSRYYPEKDYGFIVSAGICENEQLMHEERRRFILDSFEEYDD